MANATVQQLNQWAQSPSGQIILQGGRAIQQGADPQAVLAGMAGQFAGQNQSVQDFLATQGGQLLSQYVNQLSQGASIEQAFGTLASPAVGIGLTAAATAVGIPPPLSMMIGQGIATAIAPLLQGLFQGPQDKTYGSLGGDFAWRARKYHTRCLPQAYVTWMEGNGYSLAKAILNPPSGESPPWAGLSLSLAGWLLSGGFGGHILLPGYTEVGANGCYQLGIGYTLPRDAGDGWSVRPAGWWWYPYLSWNDLENFPNDPRHYGGPLVQQYLQAGIDIGATLRNVREKKNAGLSNIIYKPIAFEFAADQIEDASKTKPSDRTRAQTELLNKAGANDEKGKSAALVSLGAAALLFR